MFVSHRGTTPRLTPPRRAWLLSAALLGLSALHGAAAEPALPPAIGRPLAAARNALLAHRYPQAMAALRQAEAVPNKTPEENLIVAEMRASIDQASGDLAGASRAFQQLLSSGQVPASEAAKLMQNEISIAFHQQDYKSVVYWAERYLKSNPSDSQMRGYLIRGYYELHNYTQAARLQQQQIQMETRNGRPPREEQLQLLYNCQQHSGDEAGQLATMKQLVTYYPKPDYWLNVIDNLRRSPTFSDRLLLDVYRLEFSLSLVNKPEDAMDMAELALQDGLPGEAKTVIDKSYAGGLLGTGPEAPRQERLRALVNKTYDARKKTLGQDVAAAESDRDGNRLLALGETYVSYDMFDKGLPMMEEAIRKDQLRHPQDAKLHLGLAYWKAGQKAKAIAELKTVGGNEGDADLAQLWILRIRTP